MPGIICSIIRSKADLCNIGLSADVLKTSFGVTLLRLGKVDPVVGSLSPPSNPPPGLASLPTLAP